ncbi:hypothetical protein TSOC_003101 [Tetrabaena socialis]|uniref:Uncharacterized protein n=1 Tax=Tetrabaena socialis TaxID=47790 RepID=A0A2J8ACG6_9CHLO|nr:hypothetical protein TSOC_003101 [Tetrabaena socialis]|eukprot:PNH10209.1 hypothetical protein TSOC_003101 [Tetrabaena socialis]
MGVNWQARHTHRRPRTCGLKLLSRLSVAMKKSASTSEGSRSPLTSSLASAHMVLATSTGENMEAEDCSRCSAAPSQGGTGAAASTSSSGTGLGASPSSSATPGRYYLDDQTLTDEAVRRLMAEEEERRRRRRTSQGRLRELEEIRFELAEKELALLEKEKTLLAQEQTLAVMTEELEVERKLRALLTREKDRADEEAALAMGLCTGGFVFP